MFELNAESFIFDPSEPGSVTGEKDRYTGTFEVRKCLNPQQKALADRERRAFLGHPLQNEAIDPEVAEFAYITSQLKVRVIKGPKWFMESDNLKNFLDENILIELANKVFNVELEFRKGIQEKAAKVKQELSK